MKELGFLHAHGIRDWCLLCSVLGEPLNVPRAPTTMFYEDISYRVVEDPAPQFLTNFMNFT
jgi:hypothetical protein